MDYLYRMHKLPLFPEYERYRAIILDEPIFPFFNNNAVCHPLRKSAMEATLPMKGSGIGIQRV